MMDGWIKLHRKITGSDMYLAEPFTKAGAWIDLLLLAAYEPRSKAIRGVTIMEDRGCVLQSIENLATRWQWSAGKVRRFLADLEAQGQIEQRRCEAIKMNVIAIVNFEQYQGGPDSSDSDEEDDPSIPDNVPAVAGHGLIGQKGAKIDDLQPGGTSDHFGSRRPSGAKEAAIPVAANGTPKIDFQKIVDDWHLTCPSFSKVRVVTGDRALKIRARFVQMSDPKILQSYGAADAYDLMHQVFARLEGSSFCKGDNGTGWKADFMWIMNSPENWIKVMDDRYKDRETAATGNGRKPVRANGKVNDDWDR